MNVKDYIRSYHSELKCLSTLGQQNANQKCEDCSMPILDIIVCKACATQCHKGHVFSTIIDGTLCRCLHMSPLSNCNDLDSRNVVNTSSSLSIPQKEKDGNVSPTFGNYRYHKTHNY